MSLIFSKPGDTLSFAGYVRGRNLLGIPVIQVRDFFVMWIAWLSGWHCSRAAHVRSRTFKLLSIDPKSIYTDITTRHQRDINIANNDEVHTSEISTMTWTSTLSVDFVLLIWPLASIALLFKNLSSLPRLPPLFRNIFFIGPLLTLSRTRISSRLWPSISMLHRDRKNNADDCSFSALWIVYSETKAWILSNWTQY